MTTFRGQQFAIEDFKGLLKAEPRAEELLSALNSFARQLESIVNGGIGSDNLNRQIVELDVVASQTYPIKVAVKVKGRVLGVRPLRAVKTTTVRAGEPVGAAVGCDWTSDGALVSINGLPGLNAADKYRVTLEILGA